MIDFTDYIRKNPEADAPDLEQLLDRIDYFFGDQTNDAAEQNTQNKAERKIQRNSNTSSTRVHAPRNR